MSIGDKIKQGLFNLGYFFGSGGKSPNDQKNSPPVARNKTEYVFFGNFPQTAKPRNVTILGEAGNSLYNGSDGKLYYRKYDGDGFYPGSFFYASMGAWVEDACYSDGQHNCEFFRYEPIKWRVVRRQYGVLTLLSEHILFYQEYDVRKPKPFHSSSTSVRWGESTIRRILNDQFFNTAFNQEEQIYIFPTEISDEGVDKVFLLSEQQIANFGFSTADLTKHQTDFSGPYYKYGSAKPYYKNSEWITRTPNGSVYDDKTYEQYIAVAKFVTASGKISNTQKRIRGIVPVINVSEKYVTVYSK